jgi:uncharacterized protein with PIN domain
MAPRFVADSMLGRLAKWLRAFGFDVLYEPFLDDHGVIAAARNRGAVALTRDTGFPRPSDVRIIFVDDDNLEGQLGQLVRERVIDLREAQPMTRCTVCNHGLVPATRGEVWCRVPPFVYLTHERYGHCPQCARVYWEGSHARRMRDQLARLLRQAGEAQA